MKKLIIILSIVIGSILLIVIGLAIYFNATPSGKKAWAEYQDNIQQAEDEGDYETRKKVEDTCRSMIASYKTDKLTYETYKDSDDAVLKSSANSARIRANQTANTYNEYVLKNSYVWKDNVPDDIVSTLETI